MKLSNLMRTQNSIRQNEIELLIFFPIFMIQFELAIYSNKALDSIDSMQKRLLIRVRFGQTKS